MSIFEDLLSSGEPGEDGMKDLFLLRESCAIFRNGSGWGDWREGTQRDVRGIWRQLWKGGSWLMPRPTGKGERGEEEQELCSSLWAAGMGFPD